MTRAEYYQANKVRIQAEAKANRIALNNGTWVTLYGMSQDRMDAIAGRNAPVCFGSKTEPYFTEKEMIEGFQVGELKNWELQTLNEII